jgi:hypothetical protein
MIIKVRVVPNSKVESLQMLPDKSYRLKVKEKAVEGRANAAVIAALSLHFNVRESDVSIIKGLKGREKTIAVSEKA